jgi:hypothetical protein
MCPCCQTKLTLDSASGHIVLEERPKKAGPDWDQVVQAGADKKDILEKKFREALKRADKSDDPPPRIFDLD